MNNAFPADRGPWQWRNFGTDANPDWMLTTQNGGAQIVLCAQRNVSPTPYFATRDPETGVLVPLTPDMPLAKRLESLPTLERRVEGLEVVCRQVQTLLSERAQEILIDDDEPLTDDMRLIEKADALLLGAIGQTDGDTRPSDNELLKETVQTLSARLESYTKLWPGPIPEIDGQALELGRRALGEGEGRGC